MIRIDYESGPCAPFSTCKRFHIRTVALRCASMMMIAWNGVPSSR